jgi:hypothetical protein
VLPSPAGASIGPAGRDNSTYHAVQRVELQGRRGRMRPVLHLQARGPLLGSPASKLGRGFRKKVERMQQCGGKSAASSALLLFSPIVPSFSSQRLLL